MDGFVSVERQRLRLEDNVAALRKSLQHWRTWEAEYEGLKEEISGLGKKPAKTKLVEVGKDYGGTLLNQKEIDSLFRDEKGRQRGGPQIVGLLSRRVDYVQKNVTTVTKLLEEAEQKLLALHTKRQPDAQNEGLPLTEIRENLDDAGNIISSTTTAPRDAAPEMIEALRKAGVTGIPDTRMRTVGDPVVTQQTNQVSSRANSEQANRFSKVTRSLQELKAQKESAFLSTRVAVSSKGINETSKARKKTVTFSEDTKPDDSPKPSSAYAKAYLENKKWDPVSSEPENQYNGDSGALRGEGLGERDYSTPSTTLPIQGPVSPSEVRNSGDARGLSFSPTAPVDESLEDATLRREMLQYGMSEVGAIVAEIELDDSGSHTSFSEDEEENEQGISSTDSEEDESGRTTRRVIDEDYRRHMQELEKKLNAQAMENIGPGLPSSYADNGNGREVAKTVEEQAEIKPLLSRKRDGHLTRDLSVSALSETYIASPSDSGSIASDVRPITESIVERGNPDPKHFDSSSTKKIPSRFKNGRSSLGLTDVNNAPGSVKSSTGLSNGPLQASRIQASWPQLSLQPAASSKPEPFSDRISPKDDDRGRRVPEGPLGRTHVKTLVERLPVTSHEDTTEPDELDPALLHQEVAMEYRRMRNRMIQRNGGFLQTEEEAEEEEQRQIPGTDNEGTGGKKPSRFRAARLGKVRK